MHEESEAEPRKVCLHLIEQARQEVMRQPRSVHKLSLFSVALVEPTADPAGRRKKTVLAGLLLVGAVTPIAEIARAVLIPSWPINLSATLIGADCGRYAPHYVARLGGDAIGRLMREAHRLPLGPQGPAACSNPAHELMWSWSFKPRPVLHPIVPRQANTGNP